MPVGRGQRVENRLRGLGTYPLATTMAVVISNAPITLLAVLLDLGRRGKVSGPRKTLTTYDVTGIVGAVVVIPQTVFAEHDRRAGSVLDVGEPHLPPVGTEQAVAATLVET